MSVHLAPAADPSFGQRVATALSRYGHLCVGLDPSATALAAWGLPDTVDSLAQFSDRMIEASAGRCGFIKPQAAFYERLGAAGLAVLERTLETAREAGLINLVDVKRGDIGSTMDGYAAAYLADAAPWRADAITLSPYLGFGSLRGAIDLALAGGRGVFVLALTSNPDGAAVQGALRPGGLSVGQDILAQAGQVNALSPGLGSVGVVVGATLGTLPPVTAQLLGKLGGPILAPGLGAQGASPADLKTLFGDSYAQVIAPASRALANLGPDLTTLRDGVANLQELLAG